MSYKLVEGGVKRLSDGAFIPGNSGNKDWREYQEWLGLGNTPEPADPPKSPLELPEQESRKLDRDKQITKLQKALEKEETPSKETVNGILELLKELS